MGGRNEEMIVPPMGTEKMIFLNFNAINLLSVRGAFSVKKLNKDLMCIEKS